MHFEVMNIVMGARFGLEECSDLRVDVSTKVH